VLVTLTQCYLTTDPTLELWKVACGDRGGGLSPLHLLCVLTTDPTLDLWKVASGYLGRHFGGYGHVTDPPYCLLS